MKKTIITVFILLASYVSFGQNYQSRYLAANRDSIRTQIRMSVIDIATDRIDTATNQNRRLCFDVLSEPTASYWVDYFAYQIATLLVSPTPTDNVIRTNVLAIWDRVALINTRK